LREQTHFILRQPTQEMPSKKKTSQKYNTSANQTIPARWV
jgi:hypothetical protein